MTTPLKIAQLRACGDWNGSHASYAYLEGDMDGYCRMIANADRLWKVASDMERKLQRATKR